MSEYEMQKLMEKQRQRVRKRERERENDRKIIIKRGRKNKRRLKR